MALPGVAATELALLERLATSDVMKTEVWPRLPSTVHAGEVVNAICLAAESANGVRPPWPKRVRDVPRYLASYPIQPEFGGIARTAEFLVENIKICEAVARVAWELLWPGDPEMTFDKLVSTLTATTTYYDRLNKNAQEGAAADPLPPPPRKRGARSAKQTYFSRIMSGHFQRTCGSPLDGVVTALVNIVFDDASGGPDGETTRGRRRRLPRNIITKNARNVPSMDG